MLSASGVDSKNGIYPASYSRSLSRLIMAFRL